MLRRLLSLDYLLEHPQAAWLPTEGEKVNALAGAGIARHVLPRRLYQGAVGVQYRCSTSSETDVQLRLELAQFRAQVEDFVAAGAVSARSSPDRPAAAGWR